MDTNDKILQTIEDKVHEMINCAPAPPTNKLMFPHKPTEPLDSECCGTGCSPCVYDIYQKQLLCWEKECEEIRLHGIQQDYRSLSEVVINAGFLTQEKYLPVTLTQITKETSTSNVYRFSSETCPSVFINDEHFPVKIGQHVLIRIDNISRQYTVLRVNIKDNSFDVLIKIYPDGLFTSLIGKLIVKDKLEMRGPFGKPFEYKKNSMKQIVMLAAGTGFAPMYRIIQNILNDEIDDTKIKLLFASKSYKAIPLVKELKEWSSFWNFDVIYFCTSKIPDTLTGDNELPYYGMKLINKRIDIEVLREQYRNCDISKSFFLICGTKSFEKDMINYLNKLGVDSSNFVVF